MAKQFEFDNLPIVQTKQGQLRGYQYEGTYIFKGVKYAKAARFQKPTEPDSWEGVQEAVSYGYVSPMLMQDNPSGELIVPHRYWPQNEHCQNLNIWTQSLDVNAKKPVMVWIHGGAFSMGSSIEQKTYNGENMSKHGDVVVVSVNHRLNILGYLDMSPYGEKYENSANAGQDDLIAALRWIKENIAAFGGDPENVTIFGQSGGGMKVSGLMQMPEADGLFQKGIIMSGVAGDIMPEATGDSKPLIQAMLAELGLTEEEVEKLETVPYYELAQAYNKVSPAIAMQGGYIGCMPRRNEYYLGEGPAHGFTKHATQIPLLIGTVFGEFVLPPMPFFKDEVSAEDLKAALSQRFNGQEEALAEEFKRAYPGKNVADLWSLDTIMRCPTKQFVKSFAEAGGAAYNYLFTLEFPYHHSTIAWHCADIPFVFHNTEMIPVANIDGVSDKLEMQVFEAVMNFARTGNPNHAEIPEWPASTADDEATMIFDRDCEVRHNFDDKLLQMHVDASPKFDMMAMMNDILNVSQH